MSERLPYTLKGIPYLDVNSRITSGRKLWVSSLTGANNASANGDTPAKPLATIDYAIGMCTASAGDVIYVMPGHTETITAAGGITCDVAGVSIIGLGTGSIRPTINFTTATTADLNVTAANVTIENVIFDMTGVDAVANGIHVTAASFALRNCYILLADSGGQAVLGVLTSAAANYMRIEECDFIGSTDAGCTTAIKIVGGTGIKVRKNYISGAFTNTVGGIQVNGTASTEIDIDDNFVANLTADSTVCIDLMAACTGVVRNNKLLSLTDGGFGQVDTPGNVAMYLNLGVNQAGEASRVIPLGTLSA